MRFAHYGRINLIWQERRTPIAAIIFLPHRDPRIGDDYVCTFNFIHVISNGDVAPLARAVDEFLARLESFGRDNSCLLYTSPSPRD